MVVKNLYDRDKAVLIFQGDQRKWPVLEKISKNFSLKIEEAPKPQRPTFKLNLYAGFDRHSQVCLAREILKKIKSIHQTVVVLPNPEQVIPLISEIQSCSKDF